MNYESLLRESLRDFAVPKYEESPEGTLMHLNTSPLGPNPAVRSIAELIKDSDKRSSGDSGIEGLVDTLQNLNLYPSPTSERLREKLAGLCDINPNQILVCNGSDENLDTVFKTFINPGDRVTYPVPAYTMYPIFTAIHMGNAYQVPLTGNFGLDVEPILEKDSKLTMICNPNNPTGNCFEREKIIEILENKELVLVDEAYAEFAGSSFLPLIEDYPNLIVSRTFSKIWGLAGIRIGYLVANRELINQLMKTKPPYNVNLLSEYIALLAVDSQKEFSDKYRNLLSEERDKLQAALDDLGFTTYPSRTNFILVKSPIEPKLLLSQLQNSDIYIRDFSTSPNLEGHVRITIGTKEMNRKLIDRLNEIV